MFIHAFTHDLSKFFPSEFIPYAKKFYGSKSMNTLEKLYVKEDFKIALIHHYNRNKHHIGYWLDCSGEPHNMPRRYAKQLAVDWQAMSLAKYKSYKYAKTDAIDFFKEKRSNMKMTPMTEYYIKYYLGIPEEEPE